MSSNRSARQRLEKIFGKICMIEEMGLRRIPIEQRRKIKGYTKYDDVITYHHIRERHKGGRATDENGALVKGYNHRWLHSLSEGDKEKVNNLLIEFKATVMSIGGKGISIEDSMTTSFDPSDCIELKLKEVTPDVEQKRNKFNRAKVKRETQRQIEEELYTDEDEYYL